MRGVNERGVKKGRKRNVYCTANNAKFQMFFLNYCWSGLHTIIDFGDYISAI